jgi:hypothetical protein
MAGLVVVRTYGSRHEAEQARTVLSAKGVGSEIQADDCGALDPSLQFAKGVALLVDSKDFDRAQAILAGGKKKT